jgi:hypothetical protein
LHPDEVDEEIEDVVFIDCPLKNQTDAITAMKNLKTYANNQGDLKGYVLYLQPKWKRIMPTRSLKSNTTDILHYYIFPKRVDISTYFKCLTFLITYNFYLLIITIKRTPLLSGQKSCHGRCPLIGDFVYILFDACERQHDLKNKILNYYSCYPLQ